LQTLLLALAAVFDVLKAACVSLIFIAPFIVGTVAGTVAAKYASTAGCWAAATAIAFTLDPALMQTACNTVSTYAAQHSAAVGAAAGAAATVLTGVAEAALAPLTAAIEAVGVISAIFIGLLGWLLVITLLLASGGFKPFEGGASHFFIIFGAFVATVTPLVDVFPTFTPAIWKITRDLRKRDAKRHAAWVEANRAYEAALARTRNARIEGAYALLAERQAWEERAQAEAEAGAAAAEEERRRAREEEEERAETAALAARPSTLVPTPAYGFGGA
jgi:hypothetical protein